MKKKSLIGYVVNNWNMGWVKEPKIEVKWLLTSNIWNVPMPKSNTKIRITIEELK